VVPPEPVEGGAEPRGVEAPDLDARLAETTPEPAPRPAQGAHPVVDDTHAHALAGLGRERRGELPPHGIVREDVALEMHPLARSPDGEKPGRIVFGRVLQETDGVAGNERRAGGAGQGLVRERQDHGRARASGMAVSPSSSAPAGRAWRRP
jgi:hypothetical protein